MTFRNPKLTCWPLIGRNILDFYSRKNCMLSHLCGCVCSGSEEEVENVKIYNIDRLADVGHFSIRKAQLSIWLRRTKKNPTNM
jgi:hypothetical protein